ncbi:MAG: FtsX-like permease family protein [Rikenellaceae bacterium]
MAKWVEFFIAERTSQCVSRGDEANENRSSEGAMISRVATLAVALSVAVMIVSLAVIFGFRSEVYSHLTSNSGDIVVASSIRANSLGSYPITRSDAIAEIASDAASQYGTSTTRTDAYALRGVVLRSDEGIEGCLLKGVESTDDSPRNRNATISSELASELSLSVGDKLELLATLDNGEIRRDLYRVGAIEEVSSGERTVITTDLRNVQRLNGWSEDEVSGYDISLSDPKRGVEIANQINVEMLYSDSPHLSQVAAYATEELYPALFDWLAALDLNGVVIISIMVVVAIFNIITALLILVLERMQMIGTLKALGMNNGSLRRIFLLRAAKIALWGLAWGNGVGIALSLVQQHFRVVKLDATGYLLSSVPIELGAGWIVLLNLGVVVAIVAVVSLPTRIVGSIEPHEAIRFQ